MTAPDELSGTGFDELPGPAFSLVVGPDGVVRLGGELDDATAPVVSCVLDAHLSRGVVDVCVDLGDLDFFDLRGFAVLCAAHQRLQESGGRLRVLHPSDLFTTVATWWGVPDLVDAAALPTPTRGPTVADDARAAP